MALRNFLLSNSLLSALQSRGSCQQTLHLVLETVYSLPLESPEMGSSDTADTDGETPTSGSPAVFARQGEQAGTALDPHGHYLQETVFTENCEPRGWRTHLGSQFPGP